MADDETTDATEETKPPKEPGAGVHLPAWVLGALVVVLALAIGGAGYAIGHSSNDSNLINPIANTQSAPGADNNGGACPDPRGGMGDHDGGPLRPLPGGPGLDGPRGPLAPGNSDNEDNNTDNGGNDQNSDQNSQQSNN